MKPRSIHNLLLAALAFAGLSLMSACSDDKANNPEPDNSPTFLSFTVSLDKSDLSTRGDNWSDIDNPEDGYAFDNIVDQMTFRPVIYKVKGDGSIDESCKFVEVVPLTLLDPDEYPNSDKLNFAFTGMLPGNNEAATYTALHGKTDRYRLMIFTNGYAPVEGSIDDALTFSQIGNQKAGFSAVPMWGTKEFTFEDLKQGEALNIGEIPLLRAMAMVRVKLAPEGVYDESIGAPRDNVSLISLSVNKYNQTGNFVPQLWKELTVTNQSSHKFVLTKNPNQSLVADAYTIKWAADDNDKSKRMVTDEDGAEVYYNNTNLNRENIYFYLPEINNDKDSPVKLTIGYEVNGYYKESELDFRPLTQTGAPTESIDYGQPTAATNYLWNIVRNHIYEFTITGVQDSKITVQARVNDWKYHKGEPQPLE
ncbi:MAG: hypothetical protein K2K58_11735 [Muribaculaceae bacterium]|nr:hypothetical protein [Muribaculaceae bacterium]